MSEPESEAVPEAVIARHAGGPGLVARLGLAVISPRWALAIAADRGNAGRSGSDLIAAMLAVIAATQLLGLAAAIWLGAAVNAGLGLRKALHVLTPELMTVLCLLAVCAFAVFALAGSRRNFGRALDAASVAVLPVLLVELIASVVLQGLGVAEIPAGVSVAVSAVSYAWMGCLVALAILGARRMRGGVRVPAPPLAVAGPARRVGWVISAIAVLGVVLQAAWIDRNIDRVKPMTSGGAAPEIALPEISPSGQLGAPIMLAQTRGKVTVLDFWATWCGPCLAAMPHLEQLARSRPDVTVIAVNIDDPAAARALFTQHGYTMKLVADDKGDASERYGVSVIPHTVVIDRRGVVRGVLRGGGADLAALVDSIREP